MTGPRPISEDSVSLRELIDIEFGHQRELLNERAAAHASEHVIHLEAHRSEHVSTQTAISIASRGLDQRLESIDKEFGLKIDALTKAIDGLLIDRASARGYILGVGAVIAVVIVVANFAANAVIK